jgi:hypothetical protein
MKRSNENISTWSSNWPKEWLFSIQSSSTTTLMDRSSTTEKAILNALLRKIWCYGVRIDTHLLEMKVEATYGTKMTQCQVISKLCLPWTENLDYPQKFLLRVVAHLEPQTHLSFLASPNLGTRFLLRVVVCHIPKIWNVKINKNKKSCLLNWVKFHKKLKLFELS